MEVMQPIVNYVYFARSLTYGKSFSVSITKVLNERSDDFSFVIGFTTCSTSLILSENLRHLTEQCMPRGCGGHSQQVKIFKANAIGSQITFERQANGEIYFAINSAMPIRIQFDRNSCDINLVRHEQLIPYIQLSGSVLALKIESNKGRQLNVQSAITVRRGQPLGTATAFGPRFSQSKIVPGIAHGQVHQAFVAPTESDTKFIKLNYPEKDVKLSTNAMAILRKNDSGEQFVFYVDKVFNINSQLMFQVTKVYNADKYTSGLQFGVTSLSMHEIKIAYELTRQFITDSGGSTSHSIKISRDIKINDKFTFTRTGDGSIKAMQNGVHVGTLKCKFKPTEKVLPFIILNGNASGIIINSTSADMNMEFSQIYGFPPVDFKTTENIAVTNQTLLRWNTQTGQDGVIVNAKPFDKILKFIIREVQTTTNAHSFTFGLINSVSVGFKTPREMALLLDINHKMIIQSPAVGLKFSLYKTPYGKVTLKYDDSECSPLTLFMVD